MVSVHFLSYMQVYKRIWNQITKRVIMDFVDDKISNVDYLDTKSVKSSVTSLRKSVWILGTVSATFAFITDQVTKILAVKFLDNQQISIWPGFFNIHIVHNSGAAFSIGSAHTYIVTIFSLILTAGIVYLIAKWVKSKVWAVILGLVFGGAVGNILDRFIQSPGWGRGSVVDFIEYGGWFVGNLADIYIVISAVVIIVITLKPNGVSQGFFTTEELGLKSGRELGDGRA